MLRLRKYFRKGDNAVFLVGPFIGEITWEISYFVPFVISLSKRNRAKLVVLTRPHSFDLYGRYATRLVPLFLSQDKAYCFSHSEMDEIEYRKLIQTFYKKYKNNYEIIKHIFPDISEIVCKVKWQFPRDQQNYDFLPRKACFQKVKSLLFEQNIFVSKEYDFYQNKNYNIIRENQIKQTNLYVSYLGKLIEVLKRCEFSICDVSSVEGRLSLLLGVPVISSEKISPDEVMLLNPRKVPVLLCDVSRLGELRYEDYFRRS